MSYPENPNEIVIKNKFYPKGVKQIDIWNYYQMYKSLILKAVRSRDLMFAIMTDVNKPVMKRKGKDGKYIQLTNSNYDEIITGRTAAIYSTMRSYENIAIVDVDIENYNKARIAADEVYDIMMKFPIAEKVTIRYTGKTAFHIVCEFRRKIKIDSIRMLLEHHLEQHNNGDFTIQGKRRAGTVNLDLSPNKIKGAFITPFSLSIIGLKCIGVTPAKILSFSQSAAKIKIS